MMIILGVVIVLVLAIGGGKLVFILRYHERRSKVNIVALLTIFVASRILPKRRKVLAKEILALSYPKKS
mgnify:CR=1 FL=1